MFVITYIFSTLLYSYLFYENIIKYFINIFQKFSFKNLFLFRHTKFNKKKYSILNTYYHSKFTSQNSLELYIGQSTFSCNSVYLPEKSLFQNILITGAIGTGKTSSAMYPFTEQFISNPLKLPMLILDVKGNYYKKVKELCQKYNREDDLIVLELDGKFKYNPLHKPNLKASVLADRLKDILLLFSPNNSESYWIDKSHQVLIEAIKLCRIYNNGYVTFDEIHKLITLNEYYKTKISIIREKFIKNQLSHYEVYNLYTSLSFFEKEFFSLDLRTISILKSEITRITNCFISDYSVFKTFCPIQSELNFNGFEEVLKSRKNSSPKLKYFKLSKLI